MGTIEMSQTRNAILTFLYLCCITNKIEGKIYLVETEDNHSTKSRGSSVNKENGNIENGSDYTESYEDEWYSILSQEAGTDYADSGQEEDEGDNDYNGDPEQAIIDKLISDDSSTKKDCSEKDENKDTGSNDYSIGVNKENEEGNNDDYIVR